MNSLITDRGMRLTCAALSMSFLMIHILMLVIFSAHDVVPMVNFNYFSVTFYIVSFFIIYHGWLKAYVILTYFEVVAHMSTAVLLTGWGSGYQITLIGMNILVFFAEYVSRTAFPTEDNYVPALPMGVVGMTMYLSAFVASATSTPPYALPGEVEFWLNIAWGVIVFVINIACLQGFVFLTFTSEKNLSTQAEHDALTGLPNRHAMTRYLSDKSKESTLDGCWLAIGDIDDFKRVNDTYGHNCGDYVLQTISSILESFEGCEKICRWGGEEFLVAGTMDDIETVETQLNRLRIAIAEHNFWYEEQKLNLTMTFGVVAHAEGETLIEWVNRADKQLYLGKNRGKNQVVIG